MHVEEKQLKDFILDSGLVTHADIEEAEIEAKTNKKTLKDEFGDIIQTEALGLKPISDTDVIGSTDEASEGELKKLAEELPIVRIVDTLLKHAIIQDASDIHIEPMEGEVLVRYRI